MKIYIISMLLLSWKHNNYTWHLTHYSWHHSHCICVITHICINASLYQWHHNKYGSLRTWHTYDIIHTLHDITITLYDIIPQCLCHHSHCIHDIICPTYDITSRFYDISSPVPVTSQTLCSEHISTIFINNHTVKRQYNQYIWNHKLHMCICVITHTVFMI